MLVFYCKCCAYWYCRGIPYFHTICFQRDIALAKNHVPVWFRIGDITPHKNIAGGNITCSRNGFILNINHSRGVYLLLHHPLVPILDIDAGAGRAGDSAALKVVEIILSLSGVIVIWQLDR